MFKKLPFRLSIGILQSYYLFNLSLEIHNEEELPLKFDKSLYIRECSIDDITSFPPEEEVFYVRNQYSIIDLFGYFKLDHFRNVFQLFASFYVSRKFQIKNFLRKLKIVRAVYNPRFIFDENNNEIMNSLVGACNGLSCFGNIDLITNNEEISFRIFDKVCKKHWESLHSVSISTYHHLNKTVDSLNMLKNLKCLDMCCMYLYDEKERPELLLKNIRLFEFNVPRKLPNNFDFKRFRQITYLRISDSTLNNFHIELITMNLYQLKEIKLNLCEKIECLYYSLFQMKSIRKIQIAYPHDIDVSYLGKINLDNSNLYYIRFRYESSQHKLPSKFFTELMKLKKLKYLNLKKNQIRIVDFQLITNHFKDIQFYLH